MIESCASSSIVIVKQLLATECKLGEQSLLIAGDGLEELLLILKISFRK